MLYRLLFNYTRKNYYSLIKDELKVIALGCLLMLFINLVTFFGIKDASSRYFFCSIFLVVFLYMFKFIVVYIIEFFTLNIQYIECHYAKILHLYDSKKDVYYVEATYLDKKLKYQKKRFRYSTTDVKQNNVIFNGPNVILFYTKYTKIIVGFIFSGISIKFYNVDDGISRKEYEKLIGTKNNI